MRIVLSGGFGYLAGRIAAALRARGHEVALGARTRPPWAREPSLPLDVLDPAQAARAVSGAQAVVHLAALDEHEAVREPERALAVSGEGTRIMLEAAERAGARLLFFSTFHVLGGGAHPYAVAHRAGEAICEGRAVVLRASNGYGAPVDRAVDRWTLAHNDFCRQAVERGVIRLATSGEQHRDFVWCDDLAQAIELLLDAPPGVWQVGGGGSRSIVSVAELVRARAEARFGRPIALERPAHEGPPPEPVRFDIEPLRARGYRPCDRMAEETDRLFDLLTRTAP